MCEHNGKRSGYLARSATGAGILSLLAVAPISAEEITLEYSFERPQIHVMTIDGGHYHRVIMSDAPNAGLPGQPAPIPMVSVGTASWF